MKCITLIRTIAIGALSRFEFIRDQRPSYMRVRFTSGVMRHFSHQVPRLAAISGNVQ